MYAKEVDTQLQKIYEQALADLEPEEIEAACQACLLDSRFMPTVADVRSRIKKRAALVNSDVCLVEWEAALRYARKWHPDVGFKGYMGHEYPRPALSDAGEYALRAVGGYYTLAQFAWDEEQLVFRKRDFDASHARHAEMAENGVAPLSAGQAKTLLGELVEFAKASGEIQLTADDEKRIKGGFGCVREMEVILGKKGRPQ